MPNTQNKRLEEIRGRLNSFREHADGIEDRGVIQAIDDIAFLLAEVERLEGERTTLALDIIDFVRGYHGEMQGFDDVEAAVLAKFDL